MSAILENTFFPLQTEQFMGIYKVDDIFLFSPHLFLILSLVFWIAAPFKVFNIQIFMMQYCAMYNGEHCLLHNKQPHD